MTTSKQQQTVVEAYRKSIQGFFVKPTTYDEMVAVIGSIIQYWKSAKAPVIA